MIRLDPEIENKVLDLAKSGNRPGDIALQTGLPSHYIRKLVEKHRIKIVPQSKSKTIDLYTIIALLLKGESMSSIAEKFGVTRQYIYLIKEKCVEAGIELPRQEAN